MVQFLHLVNHAVSFGVFLACVDVVIVASKRMNKVLREALLTVLNKHKGEWMTTHVAFDLLEGEVKAKRHYTPGIVAAALGYLHREGKIDCKTGRPNRYRGKM